MSICFHPWNHNFSWHQKSQTWNARIGSKKHLVSLYISYRFEFDQYNITFWSLRNSREPTWMKPILFKIDGIVPEGRFVNLFGNFSSLCGLTVPGGLKNPLRNKLFTIILANSAHSTTYSEKRQVSRVFLQRQIWIVNYYVKS